LFSVIIAIYNAGRYLDDSISSLINQTIGLRKIQIILINDGSTDETEEICLKYKNEYKQNIF
jgi:glycosyltransferase involved in cell wall biosynthesis